MQVLLTEVYKIVNGIAPPIMNSLYQFRCNFAWKVCIRSFPGPYFPVYGLNTGKYGPEKLRIRTLFTQWHVEHQKFSGNFYRKEENHQIWCGNSSISSTVSLGESKHLYENAKSLDEFKSKVKAWKCDFCNCRLRKKYIQNVR